MQRFLLAFVWFFSQKLLKPEVCFPLEAAPVGTVPERIMSKFLEMASRECPSFPVVGSVGAEVEAEVGAEGVATGACALVVRRAGASTGTTTAGTRGFGSFEATAGAATTGAASSFGAGGAGGASPPAIKGCVFSSSSSSNNTIFSGAGTAAFF